VKRTPLEPVRQTVCRGAFNDCLEELESRLEAQSASPAASLDDSVCVYYLCTTRCESPKCSAFLSP